MNQENMNNSNPNEEVDLIRLLNYFKNGIKSIFRAIGNVINYILQFVVLLRKNWIFIVGLAALGAVYGKFIKPLFSNSEGIKSYEMVVRSNPISNYELYALSDAVNQEEVNINPKEESAVFTQKLGITSMSVEAIPKMNDVISRYYEQTEISTLRNFETDTLFYQGFELKEYQSKMEDEDYSLQRIKLKVNSEEIPKNIQNQFLNYLNNLPGVKREKESKLLAMETLEHQMQSSLNSIDSILMGRAKMNSQAKSGVDQLMLNATNRSNVEWDLLRFKEMFSKRLYGIQMEKADLQNGVQIISNLRTVGNKGDLSNPMIKYALYGLVLSILVIFGLQFNKYLDKISKEKTN